MADGATFEMDAELTTIRGALAGGLTEARRAQPGAWFAAGTVVQTDKGLLPIEQVRVGARVLSPVADAGGRDFRRVTSTVAHLDQKIYAVQIWAEGADSLTTLFATAETRFSVASPSAHGEHSVATESLTPGFALQLADGRKASVHAVGLVRRTQHAHIGFAADERTGAGMVLDLSARQIKLADEAICAEIGKLELGEAYLTPVYDFEVEEFHTYSVGHFGIWVHNSRCNWDEVIPAAVSKPEQRCFDGDTQVHTLLCVCDIEFLDIGDLVLSRCDVTGQQAYRRVVAKFEHTCDESYVVHWLTPSGNIDGVFTTAEHPFWVVGVGWVPASELKPGQKLEIVDPIDQPDEFRPEGKKKGQLAVSGRRWQAEVVDVKIKSKVHYYAGERVSGSVFNIEVEDFHTYFVGWSGAWVHNKNPLEAR